MTKAKEQVSQAVPPDEELIDAVELAKRIKMKPDTVLLMATQGRIPAIRISRRCVRFVYSEVVKALRG